MGPEHFLIWYRPGFQGAEIGAGWLPRHPSVVLQHPLWDEAPDGTGHVYCQDCVIVFCNFPLGVASQWVKGVCFVWIWYFLIWDWVHWVFFYTSFDSQDDQPDEVVQHTGGTTAAALLYWTGALAMASNCWISSSGIESKASWTTISSAFLYFMSDYGSTFYYHPGIWVQ